MGLSPVAGSTMGLLTTVVCGRLHGVISGAACAMWCFTFRCLRPAMCHRAASTALSLLKGLDVQLSQQVLARLAASPDSRLELPALQRSFRRGKLARRPCWGWPCTIKAVGLGDEQKRVEKSECV